MSGIGMDAAKEKREGAIWTEETILREVIKETSEILVNLERRLSPILRNVPTATSQTGSQPPEEAVPDLVQRLRARKGEVREIQEHVSSLLQRLEI